MSPPGPTLSPRSQNVLLLAIFLTVLWVTGVWFFSRNNGFPVYYHPDEVSKGQQIVSGELNFRHPLLLLNTARMLLELSGEPRTPENAVMAGRRASAIFTSSAVVFLVLLAWRRGGWQAGLLAAALLPLHPLIFELAHYCKEDPALLFGLSLGFLAADVFIEHPNAATAAFLGMAAGFAVSGKYVGVAFLAVALPVLFWKGKREPRRLMTMMAAFLATLFAVIALINLPYFQDPSALRNGLNYELDAAAKGGRKGLSRDVPHSQYLGFFRSNFAYPLRAAILVFLLHCIFKKKERRTTDWLLLIFSLAYTLMLSFSPKTAGRYFLAVSPLFALAGVFGVVWFGEFFPKQNRSARASLICAFAAAVVAFQLGRLIPSYRGFQRDARREMTQWIAANLPPRSHILSETRVHLSKTGTWGDAIRQDLRIEETPFLGDAGKLSDLNTKGVRYFVTVSTNYGSFVNKKRIAARKDLENQRQRRTAFYQELFDRGKLLQKTGGQAAVGTLNPEIRLYEVPENIPLPSSDA
ncbi:MAG TPA: phospholipid carrier-dependent glycosyltransferase [Chthoniobacterales bacterium]